MDVEWMVECWVNDELDIGISYDTEDEAQDAVTREVARYEKYSETDDPWVKTWAVKLFKMDKTLLYREEKTNG